MKKTGFSSRLLLKELEKTGLFVFHGSPRLFKKLEPRQQMNYSPRAGKLVKDGKPAVCVTPFIKVAIFRALIYRDWTNFGQTNGKVFLRASKEALNITRSTKKKAYVYVFRKTDFRKHSPLELRRSQPTAPLATIPVIVDDVPKGIQIIKNWQRFRTRLKK